MPEGVIPRPNLDVLARECERVGLGLSDPCVAPCMTVFSPVIRRGFFFLEPMPRRELLCCGTHTSAIMKSLCTRPRPGRKAGSCSIQRGSKLETIQGDETLWAR